MNKRIIDYRSDTVTKPGKEMRQAMFEAEVGDDVYGEDPTVNLLQDKAAAMFGMEAALFCSSGTQTNQIAINVHVQPGGEIICHEESHIYKYEGGGIARNSMASVKLLQDNRGRINAHQVLDSINNDQDIHLPLTQLVSIEDTSNRGGGAIYDFKAIQQIRKTCLERNLPLHLDGARVFNALEETKIPYIEYGKQFDSISICLSKGLGAPVGSLLLGSKDFIQKATRVRKVFGGGMRQAGFIAAAGIYALDHNISKLSIDHQHAKMLEKALHSFDWVSEIMPVETNILILTLTDSVSRDEIISKLKDKGILVSAFGPKMIRFVTHLDICANDIDQTCVILNKMG